MADNSVGMISLDLVIREKLGEQLDKIKARVSAPAEKIGESIEQAIEKPLKSAGKATAESASKAMGEAAKALDSGIDDAISRAVKRMEDQKKKLEESLSKVSEPRIVPAGPKYKAYDVDKITKEIEEFNEKIREKAEKPLSDTLGKAKEKLSGFKVDTDPTARLRQEVELLTEKISLLQKRYQELSEADPSDKTASQMNAVKQEILSATERLDKLRAKENELTEPAEKARSAFSKAFSVAAAAAKKSGSVIKSALSSAFKGIKTVGGKAISSLGNKLRGIGKAADAVTKPVSKLGRTLKNTFKRVFLVAGLYAGFRAIKDGLLEAAKADEQFSKSLEQIKANLAVAFAPIMEAILPALNSLMSGLASVTGQIAAFIAGLFGKTYKQAAATVKKLNGVTNAAKKAKAATAGIDEMNVLSGGDEDEGNDTSGYDPTTAPEPELPDWAEKLKNAIRSGDWAGIGALFADKIQGAFSKINWDAISAKVNSGVDKVVSGINGFLDRFDENGGWETLGDTVAGGLNTITSALERFEKGVKWDKLGAGIARGLNRAIKKINWKQLGRALGGLIQSAITVALNFVRTFDFKSFGTGIGEAINGWFEAIDFADAAETLSLALKGALDSISAMLRTVDFGNIGGKIADFFNNVDIEGILVSFGETVSALVEGALDLLTSLVEKTDWFVLGEKIFDGVVGAVKSVNWSKIVKKSFELLGAAVAGALQLAVALFGKVLDLLAKAWNKVKNYFDEKTEECGGNVVLGIFKGITDALANVGKWIQDHIFKPFIDGFKKAFGINSPSKVMAEMGGYIIDGLKGAISDGIASVKKVFEDMLSAIKGVFTGIGDWFGEKFGKAWDAISDKFMGAGKWFAQRYSDIKDAFKDANSWFGDKFGKARENIKTAFSGLRDWASGVASGILGAFADLPSRLKGIFNDAVDAIKSSGLFKVIDDIKEKLSSDSWGEKASGAAKVLSYLTPSGLGTHLGSYIADKIPFLASGGTLRDGSAIVGEEGPELLTVSAGLAKVTPFLSSAPPLRMIGGGSSYGGGTESGASDSINYDSSEIIELLREIITLLKSGVSIEAIGELFGEGFRRTVLKVVADDKVRRGL